MIWLEAEKPEDVNCATFEEQKEYYRTGLEEYCSGDVSSVIIDFIVWVPKVGDIVDAEDKYGDWYSAIIVCDLVSSQEFKIHFIGWAKYQQEYIKYYSKKIQPFGTNTSYKHRPHTHLPRTSTEDLIVGDYVFQVIDENNIRPERCIHLIIQGKIIQVNNLSVTIQLKEKHHIIYKNQEQSWRFSEEHVNWTCPSCEQFCLIVDYFCKYCGFTHHRRC